ncbi:MAG: hypothetical protein AAF639_15930 [Chloroflexota bacterium]
MSEVIKACIDKELPVELMMKATRLAVEENPANAPKKLNQMFMPPGVMINPANLAGITGKLWKPGRTLRVRFMDGDPQIQERIVNVSREWMSYAYIRFEYGNDPDAEIRISLQPGGSWSYIGTDNLVLPKERATMGYGWFTHSTPPEEYSRTVLHEFGHALGCIHEHQNPAVNIPWDKPAVYDYYAQQGWDRNYVDTNLFTRYGADITQFSEFDKDSIMLYPIPEQLTFGGYEVGFNNFLSPIDKAFIGQLYPQPGTTAPTTPITSQPVQPTQPTTPTTTTTTTTTTPTQPAPTRPEIIIGAAPTPDRVGSPGEVREYKFFVNQRGRYQMGTTGKSDIHMGLYDQNEQLIQEDDDGGRRLNPLITATLDQGVHCLKVRLYSVERIGDYQIYVRSLG